MENVILLNSDYTTMGIISWKKAMRLIVKGKVEVIKQSEQAIHYTKFVADLFLPIIIRLLKYIRKLYKAKIAFNKKNVFIRDNYTCQYCGTQHYKTLTIDHIIPKSKGGKSTFDNTVACCYPCNNRKDNRLPSEAKMYLKRKPYRPTIHEFILLKIKMSGLSNYLEELGII